MAMIALIDEVNGKIFGEFFCVRLPIVATAKKAVQYDQGLPLSDFSKV
jgi:hypothetical protein